MLKQSLTFSTKNLIIDVDKCSSHDLTNIRTVFCGGCVYDDWFYKNIICLATSPSSMVPFLLTFMTIFKIVSFLWKLWKFSRKFGRNVEKFLWKLWEIFVKIMTKFWKYKEKFLEILKVKIMRNFKNILLEKILQKKLSVLWENSEEDMRYFWENFTEISRNTCRNFANFL